MEDIGRFPKTVDSDMSEENGLAYYHPCMAAAFGLHESILLAFLLVEEQKDKETIEVQGIFRDPNGLVSHTMSDIKIATGLSDGAIRRARTRLDAMGVIFYTRKGLPPEQYYRIERQKLDRVYQDRHVERRCPRCMGQRTWDDGFELYKLQDARNGEERAKILQSLAETREERDLFDREERKRYGAS